MPEAPYDICKLFARQALQERYHKAKSGYEKTCIEASRAIEARNKAQADAAAAASQARSAATAASSSPPAAVGQGSAVAGVVRSGGTNTKASLMLNKMMAKAGEGVTKMSKSQVHHK